MYFIFYCVVKVSISGGHKPVIITYWSEHYGDKLCLTVEGVSDIFFYSCFVCACENIFRHFLVSFPHQIRIVSLMGFQEFV